MDNQNHEQRIDPFTMAVLEQRNAALNEAAFWRAKAVELQAELAKTKAAAPTAPSE